MPGEATRPAGLGALQRLTDEKMQLPVMELPK